MKKGSGRKAARGCGVKSLIEIKEILAEYTGGPIVVTASRDLLKHTDALLAALKDAQAVIHQLAEEGRFFDDLDKQMGLEGKINQAIAQTEGVR